LKWKHDDLLVADMICQFILKKEKES
jgi:hypothetical protein